MVYSLGRKAEDRFASPRELTLDPGPSGTGLSESESEKTRYNPLVSVEEGTFEFERFACPGCGEDVDVPAESAGKLVRCPYCSADFFASAEQAHLDIVDDSEPEPSAEEIEATFDSKRIKNITKLRMSDVRARSWWLVGLFFGVFTVLAVIWNSVLDVRLHHWDIWSTLRLLLIPPGVWLGLHSKRQVKKFQTEIDKPMLTDPATPPDFSTLDNGSERWRDLGNIR